MSVPFLVRGSINETINAVQVASMNTRQGRLIAVCFACVVLIRICVFNSTAGSALTRLDQLQSARFGSDPNTISFDVNFTNLYVNTDTVYGTFTIFGGVPRNMAVLVGATNFQDAVWMPYAPMSSYTGDLWDPTVTVYGTVSDPTYAVWVNGVKATVQTSGSWVAVGVPVPDGGTATFEMKAYAPGEPQP
jgi:hypothetical protein